MHLPGTDEDQSCAKKQEHEIHDDRLMLSSTSTAVRVVDEASLQPTDCQGREQPSVPAWDAPVLLCSVNGDAVGTSGSVTPLSGEGAASPELRALCAEVVVAPDGGVHGEAGGRGGCLLARWSQQEEQRRG